MDDACLDTGVVHLFLTKNCPGMVINLMNRIKSGKTRACIVSPVISELFYHLCKVDGKEDAKIAVNSFLEQYPVHYIDLDKSMMLSTGVLKCQHRARLSYIDCMSIAYCLKNKVPFHTTEKKIKTIPQNTLKRLKVVKYPW